MSKQEVDQYEAFLQRKQLLLPNDIASAAIKNIFQLFVTPTSEVILKLAAENRLFIKQEYKVVTKKLHLSSWDWLENRNEKN